MTELDELQIAQARKLNAEAEKLSYETRSLKLEVESEEASTDNNHTYVFFGEVNGSNVFRCMEMLTRWSTTEPACDITIVFNSPGGVMSHGLALYDHILALREKGHTVTTKGYGLVASMGAILLQAGSTRTMSPNAVMMVHEPSGQAAGTRSDMEDAAALMNKLNDLATNIMAERSTLTKRALANRWKRKDVWMDAGEALKIGLVDSIGY